MGNITAFPRIVKEETQKPLMGKGEGVWEQGDWSWERRLNKNQGLKNP